MEHIKRHHYDVVTKVGNTPEVQKLVTMTPFQAQTDGVAKLEAPKAVAPKPVAPAPKAAEVEEVAEPVKRESKKVEVPTPVAKRDLNSVLAAWSDEE